MKSRFLYGEDDRLVAWAADRIDRGCFRDDARAIGHEKNGELVAVVVFDTFSTTGCFVHIASGARKWMSREFGIVAMTYPFIQLALPRISCIVSTNNRMSLRFTRQFGWIEEGIMRRAGNDGEDIILFGMLRQECRWLPAPLLWHGGADRAIGRQPVAHDVQRSAAETCNGQILSEIP